MLINIEYRHTDAKLNDPTIRRLTTAAMTEYIRGLVFEMEMADIPVKFRENIVSEGPNTVLINGRTIEQIIEGLEIKLLDVEDSCDMGRGGLVSFGRPTLDWNRDYVEDVPDTIMKNALAKVFADENKNSIDIVQV